MSKTISVTIPDQLENDLQCKANSVGISRSHFIRNILLKWQEKQMNFAPPGDCDPNPPNDCKNRKKDGACTRFEIECNVDQTEADTCSGYNL